MPEPLFSDYGAVAIHEQTGEGLHQVDPYPLLDLTSFTADTNSEVITSESLNQYRQGARISFESAEGSFEAEAKRGTEVDDLIFSALQASSLTAPANLSFVGTSDFDVEVGVVFGGASPPPGAPTGTRIVAPSMRFASIYGQTMRPFLSFDWINAENGLVTPKPLILLRAWEDPDGLGPATPGSVLEILPASTGGSGVLFTAGSYGAPMLAVSGESPTLDFGSFVPFEKRGAGSERNWSILVNNQDGDGADGEWGGIERATISDFSVIAEADANLMYNFSFLGKKTTTHLNDNPANPGGDDFILPTLTDQASVNVDTVVTALLTHVTDFPIVFACDRAVSTGFTADVTSNNSQSTGTMCGFPTGVARGRKEPDLTLGTRLHRRTDEDYYTRITELGDQLTQEDVTCQYLLSWPNKAPVSTRKHTISWLWARNTVPKVFYDLAGTGSFLEEDVTLMASEFFNYNGESATMSYVVFLEG